MRISSKILLPILFMLLIDIALYMKAWTELMHIRANLNEERIRNEAIDVRSGRISVLRDRTRENTLFYRITTDARYLRLIEGDIKEIGQLTQEIEPLISTPTGKMMLHDFVSGREGVTQSRNDFIKAIQAGNPAMMEEKFRVWEILADNNTARLHDLINYNQHVLNQASLKYVQVIEKAFYVGLVILALNIMMLLAFFSYLNRIISVPLQALSGSAARISQGDYDARVGYQANDEIGMVVHHVNMMAKSLKKYYENAQVKMKQKENELKKMREFEKQKDIFMSIASHELKTPITSLKIFHKLLTQKMTQSGDVKAQSILRKMDHQVDKLTKLIMSLLDVTRIKAGQMAYHMNYFNVNKCLRDCIDLSSKTHPGHPISCKGRVKGKVYGDQDKISQVMDNLLSNALKYSPEGGSVEVTLREEGAQILVGVRDHGVGIEKAYQKKVFRRFFRVNGESEQTFPGLGIGLYICADIIRHHQGKIWVESEKGQGSWFRFSLPSSRVSASHS